MTRKNTTWGARHKMEQEEINRIIQEYKNNWDIDISILEASAIQAMRSQDVFWNAEKAKKAISKLRGII